MNKVFFSLLTIISLFSFSIKGSEYVIDYKNGITRTTIVDSEEKVATHIFTKEEYTIKCNQPVRNQCLVGAFYNIETRNNKNKNFITSESTWQTNKDINELFIKSQRTFLSAFILRQYNRPSSAPAGLSL